MSTERLLKTLVEAYVNDILVEEGDFGGYGDLMGAAGAEGYGMHFGSGEQLYKTFVSPFTDVFKVAAGKTKEISQRGQTLLRVAFETVATSLLPILKDSYGEVFAKEKEELDKIRHEYADVYQTTWDAFKDHDVLLMAFMYSPAGFITVDFAAKSPKIAAKLISVLTGGRLDKWLQKVSDKFGWDRKSTANKPVHGSDAIFDHVIREASEGLPPIGQVLGNPKIRERVADSPLVKKMQNRGRTLVRNTLVQVYKEAQAVTGAKSLEELQQKLGKKLPGLDKLQKIPEQERSKAEQVLLAGVKKSMKEFYVKSLDAQVKQAVSEGVPQNHPYVRDLEKVVGKIKAL